MEDTSNSTSSDVERQIADICDQFAQEIRNGCCPDIERYVRDHCDFASMLRPALHAVQCMVRLAANSTAIAVGSTLGEFRLTRFIARGGMGLVYEAEEIALGRRVALKVLPEPDESNNAEAQLVRFRNEVRAAAALDHPNIVPIYSTHSESGRHYFVMKLIDGITWGQWFAQHVRPDPYDVAIDLKIIAEALAHAHQRGIVHRDIKPSNIMRDHGGHTWVTDFGLATFPSAQTLTATGELIGTLRYMSPEQASGGRIPIDHRTDIFSLGATAYELLSGHQAIAGVTVEEQLRSVLAASIAPVRTHRADVPEDLETIILCMLAREPQDRYPTAECLAQDLQRFIERRPIVARRPSLSLRTLRWAREKSAWLMVISGILIAAVLILAMLLFRLEEARVEAKNNEADARQSAKQEGTARANEARRASELLLAQKELQQQLQLSYLSQAEALLNSDRPGRRFETLAMLEKAARAAPTKVPSAMRKRIERIAIDAFGRFDARIEQTFPPFAHVTSIDSCDFTEDLKYYTRHEGPSIQIVSTKTQHVEGSVPVTDYPMTVRFGSQGAWLGVIVEPESDPILEVWDWRAKRKSFTVTQKELGSPLNRWAMDIDDGLGLVLLGLVDGQIVGLEAESGRVQFRLRGPECKVGMARIAIDGSKIAATFSSARKTIVWNREEGTTLREIKHEEEDFALAWSPDSKMLAIGTGFNIDIVNLEHPELPVVQIGGSKDVIAEMRFHPTEQMLVAHGYDGMTRFLDLENKQTLLELVGHCNRFSPDGKRLSFRTSESAGIWQLADEQVVWKESVRQVGPNSPIYAQSSDGRSFLVNACDRDKLQAWLVDSRQFLDLDIDFPVQDLKYSRTLRRLLVLSNKQLFEIEPVITTPDDSTLPRLSLKTERAAIGSPIPSDVAAESLAFSDDQEIVAVLDEAGKTSLMQHGNKWRPLVDTASTAAYLAVDSSGRWLVNGKKNAAGFDVWNLRSDSSKQFPIPTKSSGVVEFLDMPESTQSLLITCETMHYSCWSLDASASPKLIWTVERPKAHQRGAIACSASGLVALALGRQTIAVVDGKSGEIQMEFEATQDRSIILGLGFSLDSRRLTAALGSDGFRTWDLAAIRTVTSGFSAPIPQR